jgi:hypothetical protein
MDMKNQLKQKIINENETLLQSFNQAIGRKIIMYLKKGMSGEEAMNRALQKILYKK